MGLPSFNFLGFHDRGASKAGTFQQSKPDIPNCAIWLNGLSSVEQDPLTESLKAVLFNKFGIGAVAIDAGKLQQELCEELGYCHTDQMKNLRRVLEVAKLIMESGEFTILCGQPAPVELRSAARQLLLPNYLVEVFIQPPGSGSEHSNVEPIHQQTDSLAHSAVAAGQHHDTELQIHTAHLGVERCTALIIDFLEAKLFT
ncbi:MAG: adenylyl-sulfate kinase [Cellvibrionaceae bacterium]|nr:adenylyl-sulfate kinase [Cellvibrionaceae bacterium]